MSTPRLYRTAKAFFSVGVMYGSLTGLADFVETTSKGDHQQKELMEYLSAKVMEYEYYTR